MVVPALLTTSATMVFPFEVIVPVPAIVTLNEVYVPVLDNVNAFKFSDAKVAGLNEVVPKSSLLYQVPPAPVVNVAILAPVVNVKFGALDDVPPEVTPTVNDLVTDMAATVNPPVPVQVNPIILDMSNTVVPAVVCDNTILPVPNAIARVKLLVERNLPVVMEKLARLSVPVLTCVALVTDVVSASARVVISPVFPITVKSNIVFPRVVIVPVPKVDTENEVYVPPLDKVSELTQHDDDPIEILLPVKFK